MPNSARLRTRIHGYVYREFFGVTEREAVPNSHLGAETYTRSPNSGQSVRKKRVTRGSKATKDLTPIVRDLQKRVAQLEAKVFWKFETPLPARRPPGPAPTIPDASLWRRRDALFVEIAECWPDLRMLLRTSTNERTLYRRLRVVAKGEEALRVVRNLDALWAFLKHKRFRDDPLQLANAMAGVPEIAWKTSLNRCAGKETVTALHPHAWRSHLAREMPDVLRGIEAARNEEEYRAAVGAGPTADYVLLQLRGTTTLGGGLTLSQAREVLARGKPRRRWLVHRRQ